MVAAARWAFRSADAGVYWAAALEHDGQPLLRSADAAPVTVTFRGDQIVIHHRAAGWTYTVASPLPGESPTPYDYLLAGDQLVLFVYGGSGRLWRGAIRLPILWLPERARRCASVAAQQPAPSWAAAPPGAAAERQTPAKRRRIAAKLSS